MATITAAKDVGTTGSIRGNPTFRRLLGASSISMLGSHVTTIAYPLLVLKLTGSPFTAGCVAFAAAAPSVLAYIPAGALVDRSNPRRLMLTSELCRGLAIATVVVTLALGEHIIWLLMAVAAIEGVLEVFSGLAERRYIGSLVERDDAPSALVSMEARTHVVVVMGRPLGGLLFGITPILPFLADVASFVYSVVTLKIIGDNKSDHEASKPARGLASEDSLINEIRQGLGWIRDDRFARMAIISFSVGTLFFQALIMVFLGDAHSRHLSAYAIGMVLAASGVGGALGSAAASWLLKIIRYPWIRIQTPIWFAGFALLALPGGRQFFCVEIVMAVLGFTGAVGNLALDTHVAKRVDTAMVARVTSVSRLASYSACAIGPVLGGVLVQGLGVPRAMAGLFLSTPILLLLAAFTPRASSNQASAQVAAASDAPVRAGQIFQGVVLVPAPAVRRETAEPVPVWVEFPTGQTSAGADARPARWIGIRERSGADGESQGAGSGSGRAAVTSAG
jgi:MFS family permease